MLKQCIHDGFGLSRFGERLAGPEYVERFMKTLYEKDIDVCLRTFVTRVEKLGEGFCVVVVSSEGLKKIHTKTLVLATGCRERSAKQVFIHGTRPAGVFTARNGAAFYKQARRSAHKALRHLGFGRYRTYHGSQAHA